MELAEAGRGVEGSSDGTAQDGQAAEPATQPPVNKEIAFTLTGKEAGLCFRFKVAVENSIITKLLESSVEEIDVSYENVIGYEEMAGSLEEVKLPKGARIENYEELDVAQDGGTNQPDTGNTTPGEETDDEEGGINCMIISVGEKSYRLAVTKAGDAFGAEQMKAMCDTALTQNGRDKNTAFVVENIAGIETSLYRMGEVSVAIFIKNGRNYMLFLDDESGDFEAVKAAAKLFLEA